MLKRAIAGRTVIAETSGQIAPWNKNSNLYKAITAAGYTPDDLGKRISVAIGAHRRNYSDGFELAIVKI